jgi:hypothetical protein
VVDHVLTLLDRRNPFDVLTTSRRSTRRPLTSSRRGGTEVQIVAIAGDPSAPPARRYAAAEALLEGRFTGWRSPRTACARSGPRSLSRCEMT